MDQAGRNNLIMTIVVAVAVLGGAYLLFRPHPAEPILATDTGAWTVCKKFVSQELKAPSTAVYPSISQARIQDTGGGNWTVVSYVDAQNSFGAMLRQPFSCQVHYVGNDQWTRSAVNVG